MVPWLTFVKVVWPSSTVVLSTGLVIRKLCVQFLVVLLSEWLGSRVVCVLDSDRSGDVVR